MTPLALYMKQAGAVVYGCDDALTPRVRTLLRDGGVQIVEDPESLPHLHYYIRTAAVRDDNPLYLSLRKKFPDIPFLFRGEALARVVKPRKLVAVAGSHGKTTTTAMLAHYLRQAGQPVEYLVGGLPDGFSPARFVPEAKWLVSEIDESDGTIENFSPEITIFLNFDWDHPAHYRTKEEIDQAWIRLGQRTRKVIIVPANCPDSFIDAWSSSGVNVIFYENDAEIEGVSCDFNERNRSAALCALSFLQFDLPKSASSELDTTKTKEPFTGVYRRQTWHMHTPGLAIIEDYAHHPREITAFLDWLRTSYPNYSLHVFFQPHRHSRTRQFIRELVESLSLADEISLFPVYAAGEEEETGTVPVDLKRAILAEGGNRISDLMPQDWLSVDSPPNLDRPTLFAFVGAGDQNEWAPILAALFQTEGDKFSAFTKRVVSELGAGAHLRENVSLAHLTTIRVGGTARIYAEPEDSSDLSFLLQTAHRMEIPCEILGNGSNLLVGDGGFQGLIIHLRADCWKKLICDESTGKVRVGAGLLLQTLSRRMAREGWSGFEFLEGIPGSVGGALRMNAGAMGDWFGNRVERVAGYSMEGKPVSWEKEDLDFAYRGCPALLGYCLTEAWLEPVAKENPDVIRLRMKEYAQCRRGSQPGGPSAGCMFRNPNGDSAGRLIDSAGLKGFKWGGMQISRKHANFLEQTGDASCRDVLYLLDHVRKEVAERSGVWLEPEVRLLGAQWLWEEGEICL